MANEKRLIDADKLYDIIEGCVPAPYEDSREAKEDCLAEIVNAPTVEAVSREEFRAAVNELCRLCGCYTNEHDGACNGCKWRERRNT